MNSREISIIFTIGPRISFSQPAASRKGRGEGMNRVLAQRTLPRAGIEVMLFVDQVIDRRAECTEMSDAPSSQSAIVIFSAGVSDVG